MTDNNSGQTEREIAQKVQMQFRFYAISLIFTLLALSVQTANFGHSKLEIMYELLSWSFLLASGLSGLWYIEGEPVFRVKLAYQSEYSQHVTHIKALQLQGEDTSYILQTGADEKLNDRLASYESALKLLNSKISELNEVAGRKYNFSKYCFIAGIILLFLSRSSAAIASLFGCTLL